MRRCLDCRTLIGAPASRCPDHVSALNKQRMADRGDKYGYAHRQERKRHEALWRPFGGFRCWRCNGWVANPEWDEWDLDHGPLGYAPTHAKCNRGKRRDDLVNKAKQAKGWVQ